MGEMADYYHEMNCWDEDFIPPAKVFTKPFNADKWQGDAPKTLWRTGDKRLIRICNMEFQHLVNTVLMIERGDPEHKSRVIYKALMAEIKRREKE